MSRTRVMAITVASGRMCYVCFEGKCLLDWGLSNKASQSLRFATDYATKWITLLKPDVVVTEDTNIKCRKGTNTKSLVNTVRQLVSSYELLSVELTLPRRHKNKYDEAASYASAFPDIRQKMPKPPRIWESEPIDTVYIEAIGLALEIVDPDQKLVA